jgi:hypothetical protein
MPIIFGKPPIFDRVAKELGPEVVSAYFTWEGRIWSLSGTTPPPEIVAHEERHVKQQESVGGSQSWWEMWLTDPDFRLRNEALAYGAQIAWLRAHRGGKEASRQLAWIASMLGGKDYGYLCTPFEATYLVLRASRGA